MSPRRTGAPTRRHPYQFPLRQRLTRGAEFEAVFKEGRRSADRLFTVLYRPSGLDHARLGMTASIKRVRTAVSRNRVRRLIRESFRHAADRLVGVDVVVIVKEGARDAGNAAVFDSLQGHWAHIERAHAGA